MCSFRSWESENFDKQSIFISFGGIASRKNRTAFSTSWQKTIPPAIRYLSISWKIPANQLQHVTLLIHSRMIIPHCPTTVTSGGPTMTQSWRWTSGALIHTMELTGFTGLSLSGNRTWEHFPFVHQGNFGAMTMVAWILYREETNGKFMLGNLIELRLSFIAITFVMLSFLTVVLMLRPLTFFFFFFLELVSLK